MELECALGRLVPHSEYFAGVPPPPAPDQVLQVSRFAYIRFEHELVLSSPRAYAHLILAGADPLRLYHALCRGASLAGLTQEFGPDIPAIEIERFAQLLLAAAIVDPVPADASDALRQWQFHDLLLHAESRLGRNMGPLGGTYRFIEELRRRTPSSARAGAARSSSSPRPRRPTRPTPATATPPRRSRRCWSAGGRCARRAGSRSRSASSATSCTGPRA